MVLVNILDAATTLLIPKFCGAWICFEIMDMKTGTERKSNSVVHLDWKHMDMSTGLAESRSLPFGITVFIKGTAVCALVELTISAENSVEELAKSLTIINSSAN
jgi:hypothetical protein